MLERLRSLVSPALTTTATLADVVARVHRDRVLLTLEQPLPIARGDGLSLTGADIRAFVARAAFVLEAHTGVRCGDRVGIVVEHGGEVLLLPLAVMRLGAVAVPVDPSGSADVPAILAAAGVRALVVDRDAWDRLASAGVLAPFADRVLVTGPAERLPAGATGLEEHLDAAVERGAEPIEGKHPAAIFFSSGASGGAPRGVVLSSEAIALRARALLLVRFPASMLGVMALPVPEIMGLFGLLLALAGGLPVHLLDAFDPERALARIAERRATAFFALPEMYRRMAEVGLDRFDLSSVRFWISAAERMPTELIRDFKRRGAMFRWGRLETEAIFIDAYGSVELSGAAVIRFSPPGLSRWDGSFLGFPVPPYRARVCDEAGRAVRRGEVGELWIQGPGLPEDFIGGATSAALTSDGWVRTGDLATHPLGGLVRFVDRKSDVIRCGSYAVYPAEIERVLEAHPAIETVVAFGVPHPTKREMPVAVVVVRKPDTSPDELLAWARERLVDHKAPRRIWIVEDAEIPRVAHRVRRGELRERYRETFAG